MKSSLLALAFGTTLFFNLNNMTKQKFIRKPTHQCLEYIKSFNIELSEDATDLSIPGSGGLVYNLPTGEIVLIPTDFELNYSGFIFGDITAFKQMVSEDFFPVADNEMTAWEIEKTNLENIPKSVNAFKVFLKDTLEVESANISSSHKFELLYTKVCNYVKNKHHAQINKERLVLAFGILIMDFLEANGCGNWSSFKRYEIYNSYDYPILKTQEQTRDVINDLYILLSEKQSDVDFAKNFIGISTLLSVE